MTPRFLLLCGSLLFACGCNAAAHSQATLSAQPASAEVFADSKVDAERAKPQAAAETATASTSEQPVIPKLTLAGAFDLQLKRLINDEPSADMPSLSADERNLVSTIVDALATFRQAAKNEGSLLTTKASSLAELSERIKAMQPLALTTLALCRSVTQYGVYDPIEPARFIAGKETPVIIYCEVDNFQSRPTSDARWETKLSYEAVLYSDAGSGVSVITKKPTAIVDRCRNKRRDFFLADRMNLPATLPVGKYVLKVTIIDQLANRVAEKSLAVMVAAD